METTLALSLSLPYDTPAMSTLLQIESAVAGLPPQDHHSLLTWLQDRLLSAHKTRQIEPNESQSWLQRLEQLRGSVGTGKSGASTEEIIDDLRSERGG